MNEFSTAGGPTPVPDDMLRHVSGGYWSAVAVAVASYFCSPSSPAPSTRQSTHPIQDTPPY